MYASMKGFHPASQYILACPTRWMCRCPTGFFQRRPCPRPACEGMEPWLRRHTAPRGSPSALVSKRQGVVSRTVLRSRSSRRRAWSAGSWPRARPTPRGGRRFTWSSTTSRARQRRAQKVGPGGSAGPRRRRRPQERSWRIASTGRKSNRRLAIRGWDHDGGLAGLPGSAVGLRQADGLSLG